MVMPLFAFRSVIAPRIRIPRYDFDRATGIHQVRPIADATCTGVDVIRSTLLRFDDAGGQGSAWLESWLVPVGNDEYTSQPVGYQYCPDCLSVSTPFFRKRWRYSFSVACIDHRRLLVDQCGRCGASVHAFAVGLMGLERFMTPNGDPPFVRCVHCGWDLREGGVSNMELDDHILSVEVRHQDLLNAHLHGADPSDYFWMLHHATELFSKEIGTLPFELLKTRHRAGVLQRACWLLNDERWWYIQSVCLSPRAAISPTVTNAKKPAHRVLPPDAEQTS